jgi:hypothetical protein
MVEYFLEDYLHRISLGACKRLFASQFGVPSNSNNDHKRSPVTKTALLLPKKVKEIIDQRFNGITFPTEVHAHPRNPTANWYFFNGNLFKISIFIS